MTAQANAGSEGSSIGLGWGAVSGATHYVIERSSKGPYREWTVDTRTFTDTEIFGDHVYTYFVRAKNASGLGPRSRPVIVRSLVQGNITPKAPDGLRASEATAGRVVLNWTQFQRVNTAAGLRISGFRILRQNLDDGSDLMCGLNPDGAQTQADYWYCHKRQFVLAASCCGERGTSYTDSNVRPHTQYRYWIQAINTNGVGDRSDPVLIRTKRTVATPLAPGLLNPWESSNARGTVNLKWSASASTLGITNYVLQRKLVGAAWVTLNISGWTFETSVQGDHQYVEWRDTGVSANSAYSYRVAAVNSSGQGEWSDELSIETEGIAGSPARPRMFKANRHASDPSILVATWEAVPTAATYVLKVYDVHDNYRLFLDHTITDGSTSYEVRNVRPNTAYVFKLHATNIANLNGAAATAHVTSAAALGTPGVGSLAVDVYTGGQVQPGFRMFDFKWEPFEVCRHRYRIQYYDTVNAMESNWSWKHFYDLNTHFPPSRRRVTKVSNASPHERASLGGVIFRVACINQVNANYWEAHGVVAEAAVDIPSASARATAAPPAVTGVSVISSPGADGRYGAGETIEVTARFTEPVTVDTTKGTPTIRISVGGEAREAAFDSGSGTQALVFAYTVTSADGDAGNARIVPDGLALNGGTIRSGIGADADLAYDVGPVVTGVSIASDPGEDGTWAAGETIAATVRFSEAVTVDTAKGTPTLVLVVGGPVRAAAFDSGSGTAELTFAYTTAEADVGAGAVGIAANSLALNGGTIRNEAGLDADLAHRWGGCWHRGGGVRRRWNAGPHGRRCACERECGRGDRLHGDARPGEPGGGDGGLRHVGRHGDGGRGLHRAERHADFRARGDGEDRLGRGARRQP